jgi:putative tricarboxylic transport membrane protein
MTPPADPTDSSPSYGTSRRIGAPAEFGAGVFFMALGALGLWLLRDVRLGTAMRMGPGFLPTAVCYGLLLFGLIMAGRSLVMAGPPLARWHLRPLGVVLGSLLVFAAGIPRLGLFATTLLVVAVAALATAESRWREVVVIALALAAFSTSLFVWALGLPIPAWPPMSWAQVF